MLFLLSSFFKIVLICSLLFNGNFIKKINSIFIIILFKVIKCDENEYKLIHNLLSKYNLFARPSLDHKNPTNVTFDLSLSQLIDVVYKIKLLSSTQIIKT